MPPLTTLIKPASGNCNLRCKYCFYYDVMNSREVKNYGIMTEETLEQLVKKAFEFAEGQVTFAFQGGEPTMASLDFFKKLIIFEKKYNTNNIKVNNALQTNGIVIDEEWATFFHDNNFLIGISMDGYKDIHNYYRIYPNGEGTFNRILKTTKLFDKYDVMYNILCVVNKHIAKHGRKVYNFYKKQGFKYLQFIPCLDEIGEEPGKNPYSLTPKDYEIFLKNIFDLWYEDFVSGNGISIRMFDNIVQIIMGYEPESCDMRGHCSVNAVIEADGSVYPCDFYVLDEWKLGNVVDVGLDEIFKSERAVKFLKESINTDPECQNCEFYRICRGGCKRHKEPKIEGKYTKNYFCNAYKEFYKYTLPRFIQITRNIR
ncbi:anaerobic sulfatase maturase [Vallitalea sp.]|uniref:anaerobic sulfatase maturase n=1 Tax=Vallitalea sp. TaxID=1882829 RepID=UPI0025F7E2F0|nr:anaerobic sulfatase maturase [Vallitalea sp.]MCT4686040.1 anaerobic sulfatase maturase [Vallitalea sp.]